MRILRAILVCALLIPMASAQQKFIGSYPAAAPLAGGELMPVVQGGALLESSPAAMLTYIQQFFTFNFSNIGNGTNTNGTLYCATGCSISYSAAGTINANQLNGLAVPARCGIATTNSASQITCVDGTQYTPTTWAAINAIGCAAGNNGQALWITDSNQTTYRGNITGSTPGQAVLAICNGTNWTAH